MEMVFPRVRWTVPREVAARARAAAIMRETPGQIAVIAHLRYYNSIRQIPQTPALLDAMRAG